MKIQYLYISVLLLCLPGCVVQHFKESVLERELNDLLTIADKRVYLENIFESDQELRQEQDSELLLEYGKASKEVNCFYKKINQRDALNLEKVEAYLSKFGYPNNEKFGEIATCTPLIVIHHSNSYEDRERNFKVIYKAYLKGNIDDGGIALYLNRMYAIKYNKPFRMKSPFKSIDEINYLIDFLDLNTTF